MKLTYDPRYNVAYLRFRDKPAEVETVKLSDEVLIDLAPDGTLYGIELLNANEQLRAGDAGRFVVVDACGAEHTIPLAGDSSGRPTA